MGKMIIDCETTGLAPIVKETNEKKEVIRVHKRLICISVVNLDNNEVVSFYGSDEKKMLVDFFDYCDKGILTQLVGFNLSFDLNFIRVRSFVNNVKIPPIFLRAEILDLRRIISLEEYSVGTLRTYGECCGVIAHTENGSQMIEMFEKGNWDFVKDHCEEDVSLTKIVLERCKECGLIQ